MQMPSKSASQQRLMRAAAHTPGGYDGVPQSVGKDFVAADKATGTKFKGSSAKRRTGKSKSYMAGIG